jgi:hypothetical protein
MNATLKCPKCTADIPLTDAFRKEIESEVLAEEHARHAKELEEARTAAASAAAKKAEQEHASREAGLRAEATEEKERNGRLLKQLEELTGEGWESEEAAVGFAKRLLGRRTTFYSENFTRLRVRLRIAGCIRHAPVA